MNDYHVPVFADEIIKLLLSSNDGIYVDATLGGGGHSEKILRQLSPQGLLLGIDTDDEAIHSASNHLAEFTNKIFVQENFRNIAEVLDKLQIEQIQGILFDLGVSSHQIDEP